jgi:methionyl aminopeptidase
MNNVLTKEELVEMRQSCQIAADVLLFVGKNIKEGMSTFTLNQLVHDYILSKNATPSPLNYKGFPRSICTSINDVVCHGIPTQKEILKNGDIINVDITVYYPKENGFHGDTSATFYIGNPTNEAKLVVETSRECLKRAIEIVKPGDSIGLIGNIIEEYANSQKCSVVKDYVGHGVGRIFHDDPSIHHTKRSEKEQKEMPIMKPGMVFTIEPMINLLEPDVVVLEDGWTVKTKHKKNLSAQFEHTILVTEDGHEILTNRTEILENSENNFV